MARFPIGQPAWWSKLPPKFTPLLLLPPGHLDKISLQSIYNFLSNVTNVSPAQVKEGLLPYPAMLLRSVPICIDYCINNLLRSICVHNSKTTEDLI